MKAVIGRYFKTVKDALKHAEDMKRMWKGRVAWIVVGNENKGFVVISESAARACGLSVPLKARKYQPCS